MKSVFVSAPIVLGLIFLALAALYWLTPAGGLPAFLPGFRAGSTAIHVKHAVGMLVIGLALLAVAWFGSRRASA
jgi:ammonia channel protein AmtB